MKNVFRLEMHSIFRYAESFPKFWESKGIDDGASVRLLAPPPPASSIDFVLPSILRAASHAGRIKFDHQPLFEKGACAPPPSSNVDWTQVSGGNRAWVAWVRIRKQIFVREHLLRRLKDRMHT